MRLVTQTDIRPMIMIGKQVRPFYHGTPIVRHRLLLAVVVRRQRRTSVRLNYVRSKPILFPNCPVPTAVSDEASIFQTRESGTDTPSLDLCCLVNLSLHECLLAVLGKKLDDDIRMGPFCKLSTSPSFPFSPSVEISLTLDNDLVGELFGYAPLRIRYRIVLDRREYPRRTV